MRDERPILGTDFDPLGPAMFPGRRMLRTALRVFVYACLGVVAALLMLPLFWMLSTSFRPIGEALSLPPRLWPETWTAENYAGVREAFPFWRYLANTLWIAGLNVVGTVLSCSLVAYGFSRFNWPGRDRVFALSIATLMVPFPVLLVPLYSMFSTVGWIGSFKPLWVPAFFGSAYYIFLLRQFFLTVPNEIPEAARIDGASELRVFAQIVFPLATPALLVVGLFSFLFVWNDFLSPLIFLTDLDMYTLQLGLWDLHTRQRGSEITVLMAASALVILPVFLLFFLFQNTFVRGVSLKDFRS